MGYRIFVGGFSDLVIYCELEKMPTTGWYSSWNDKIVSAYADAPKYTTGWGCTAGGVYEDLWLYGIRKDGTASLLKYLGEDTIQTISIPSVVDNITVTALTSHLFFKYNELTSVEIPETIDNIGFYCFAYCKNLHL